jgi:hypothetical protein
LLKFTNETCASSRLWQSNSECLHETQDVVLDTLGNALAFFEYGLLFEPAHDVVRKGFFFGVGEAADDFLASDRRNFA